MTIAADRRNPYIVGSAISDRQAFFGREKVFQFVEENLKQAEKVILLHGQRRIGKSSVILQIPNFVESDGFVFIPFDLQNKGHLALSNLLRVLSEAIINHIKLELDDAKLPSEVDLATDPIIFSQKFLPGIYKLLEHKNIVLMLDEFDVLNSYDPTSSVETFFPYLQSLLSQHDKLFIIPVIGRQPDDMPKLLTLFRRALTHRIGLLSLDDTEKLITEPAKGSLLYAQDSIQAIFELSKGHPYFTQLLCYALFMQARTEQKDRVTPGDVQRVVDKAIEIGEGGFAWFRDGLPIPERVIFSSVAEAQKRADLREDRFVEELSVIFQEYGVSQTESLLEAERQLVEWDFLDFASDSENTHAYRVKVELVRRWLVKQHPLRQEIWELEQLEPAAQRFYQSATEVEGYQLLENAIKVYEQALSINPNHFNALFKLAEGYLEMQEFSQAVELYKRAYQVDSNRAQEGYVQSLQDYGLELMDRGEFELAKEQFTPIWTIQPDNVLAQEKLQEIETYLSGNIAEMKLKVREIKSNLDNVSYGNFANKHPRTGSPIELTSSCSRILEQLDMLVLEASKKFPMAQVDSLFEEGKNLLDVRRIAVNNKKFEKGKATLFQVVSIIEENLMEEGRKSQPKADPNRVKLKNIQNQSTMKHKVSEIKLALNNTNYNTFASKHPRTGYPQELTNDFKKLLMEVDGLVSEALEKFPRSQVDHSFKEGKELLDVRRRSVKNNDFENGKAFLLQVVSIIEQNLIEEERREEEKKKQQTTAPSPVSKPIIQSQSAMIFVSYYDAQILQELKTVFNVLGELAPEMDNLQSIDRGQSESFDTVSQRINEIRSCSSAIVCLPPQNLSDESINSLAYLDLGACLALLPERTLLIHQGNNLPRDLIGKVETFQYLGSLDFQNGMELARKILTVLHKDS